MLTDMRISKKRKQHDIRYCSNDRYVDGLVGVLFNCLFKRRIIMANTVGEFLSIFLLGVAWGLMLPLIGDVNRNRRVVWTRSRRGL